MNEISFVDLFVTLDGQRTITRHSQCNFKNVAFCVVLGKIENEFNR